MRIVFNKNYDSDLSKEMLSLTNIEIAQVNPENGIVKVTQRRQNSLMENRRETLDDLSLRM